jgi:membrane associated rhomboid family serine protease
MFPIRDENPHFLTPYATYALIALNVLAWVVLQGLGTDPALARSLCNLALIPGELLQTVAPGTRIELGPGITCQLGSDPAWYTPVTSMFLHGGWFHLIGNMWFLWIFGNNVEDSMGHVRFAVFYLLCGLAAAGLQVAIDPDSAIPMVGASGAIGGVMGAYVMLYPKVRVYMLVFLGFFVTTFTVPAMFMLGYWFLIQLVSGFTSLGNQGGGVAFWAHIGGFVAGGLLILLFRDAELVRRHPYHGWNPRGE